MGSQGAHPSYLGRMTALALHPATYSSSDALFLAGARAAGCASPGGMCGATRGAREMRATTGRTRRARRGGTGGHATHRAGGTAARVASRHGRWGHRALPPSRTRSARNHGAHEEGTARAHGMPSNAPRRWRGGAMGTSRPTATGHEGCARRGRGGAGRGRRARDGVGREGGGNEAICLSRIVWHWDRLPNVERLPSSTS